MSRKKTTDTAEAVEMFVGGLVLDPNTQSPVVVLKDESGEISLPIWIGMAEATSIASALKQVEMARPLTHDLLYTILGEVGVQVERILITELKDSTYFAELVLANGDRVMVIDSRPSDAIGVALRAHAPIYVASEVLAQAKVMSPTSGPQENENSEEGKTEEDAPSAPETDFSTVDKTKWNEILDNLDPDDFKYKM